MTGDHTRSVLDHGMVRLCNVAGPVRRPVANPGGVDGMFWARDFDADDTDPAHAARLSFEQGAFGDGKARPYETDMKLVEYLLVNEHSSPIEMIQCWFEVKVPIFIDRQMVRHRTWKRNESSARYIVLPDKWYIPEVVGGKAANKKQGQDDNLPPHIQEQFKTVLGMDCAQSYQHYLYFMDAGVAPEHARLHLHLNHYVHWIGSVDLHNLFHFLRLRTHDHAQIEARKYAEAIVDLLRGPLPGLMGLFAKHVRKPA